MASILRSFGTSPMSKNVVRSAPPSNVVDLPEFELVLVIFFYLDLDEGGLQLLVEVDVRPRRDDVHWLEFKTRPVHVQAVCVFLKVMRQGIVPNNLELVSVLGVANHLFQREVIVLNEISARLKVDLQGLLVQCRGLTLEYLLCDMAQFLFFKS